MAGIYGVTIDPRMVKKLVQGDPIAQEEVYRKLSRPVFNMAIRVIRDRETAEEVTQDTFVDVLTKVSKLKNPKSFVGWVRTIAINHCLMRIRSPWHQRRDSRDVGDLDSGTPQNETEEAVAADQLLARLPERTRLVVWLFCVEGYTHDEIGRALGKSSSYSKSQVNRALKKLREEEEREVLFKPSPTPLPEGIA